MNNRDFAQEGKWQTRQRQREDKAGRKDELPENIRVEKARSFIKRLSGKTADFLIFDEFHEVENSIAAVSFLDPLSHMIGRREFSRNEVSKRSVAAHDIGKLDLTSPRRFHKSTFLKSMINMISDKEGLATLRETATMTSGSSRDSTLSTITGAAHVFHPSLHRQFTAQFKPIEIDWERLAKMRKEQEDADAAEEKLLHPIRVSLGYGEW